jgi:hypothetical protein
MLRKSSGYVPFFQQPQNIFTDRVAAAVTPYIHIWEVPGSNLERHTGYPDRGFFRASSVLPG